MHILANCSNFDSDADVYCTSININHFVITFHYSQRYQNIITLLYNVHARRIHHVRNAMACYIALCVGNKPSCRCKTTLG